MADGGARTGNLWWQHRWVLAALILATALPVFFTTLPPLTDYFGHMGRYRVQLDLATSPYLQKNWDFQWALIANLGVDLLIIPLAKLFGLERAIWIVAVILPPFLAWGMVRTAKAAHGHVPATAIAALPLSLAYPYQFGFVNFWLGLGIAFHLYASWRSLDRAKPWQLALFAMASVALWLCHIFAWGVMCVLVATSELTRYWQEGTRNPLVMAWKGLRRCWPLMLPLLFMAIWRSHGAGAETLGWFRWTHKFRSFVYTLRDQNYVLDLTCIIILVLIIYTGVRHKDGRWDRGLGFASLVFASLVMLFPFQLFGSAYADARMWPILMMTALLTFGFEPEDGSVSRGVAWVAIAMFVVRIGVSIMGFQQYERDNNRHLVALNYIERGARVAVVARYPCPRLWRRWRIEHMGSIALLRREAFVNSQWDVPGAQLLKPLAAKGTQWNSDPSQFIGGRICGNDMRREFRGRIKAIPLDRFDYVWLLDIPTDPPQVYPHLKQLYADERTVLYKIEKGEAR